VILRPYQSETIAKLRALIASGKRKLVAVAPTGAGKTVIASEIIRGAEAKGSRTLFLAHRKELIDQSFAKLEAFGVRAGVIMASDRRRDDYLLAQVASVQTLRNRMDRLPEAKLVIVDECHHSTSQTYRQLIDHYYDRGRRDPRPDGDAVAGWTTRPLGHLRRQRPCGAHGRSHGVGLARALRRFRLRRARSP
jgi:superfamily II DNA or RNA helicase